MDNSKKVVPHTSDVRIYEWLISSFDLDKLSQYIDHNLKTFRYVPYVVGFLGVTVIFRSVRLATKFTKANQIPQSFIRKNVQLRGRIKSINLDGSLEVEHLPIVRLPWHVLYRDSFLKVHLAYISPTISGTYWMRLNVKEKPVKFLLINRNREQNALSAQVVPVSSKMTLNETLVRNGLAKIDIVDVSKKAKNKKLAKAVASLEKCQEKAVKNRLGMWSELQKKSNWIIPALFQRLWTK